MTATTKNPQRSSVEAIDRFLDVVTEYMNGKLTNRFPKMAAVYSPLLPDRSAADKDADALAALADYQRDVVTPALLDLLDVPPFDRLDDTNRDAVVVAVDNCLAPFHEQIVRVGTGNFTTASQFRPYTNQLADQLLRYTANTDPGELAAAQETLDAAETDLAERRRQLESAITAIDAAAVSKLREPVVALLPAKVDEARTAVLQATIAALQAELTPFEIRADDAQAELRIAHTEFVKAQASYEAAIVRRDRATARTPQLTASRDSAAARLAEARQALAAHTAAAEQAKVQRFRTLSGV